jgi:hypothetical protein
LADSGTGSRLASSSFQHTGGRFSGPGNIFAYARDGLTACQPEDHREQGNRKKNSLNHFLALRFSIVGHPVIISDDACNHRKYFGKIIQVFSSPAKCDLAD